MIYQPSPEFSRLRTALLCGQPDRVPLAELWIDQKIMEAFLGQPVGSHDTGENYDLSAEIEFWYLAGYDYIHIEPRYFFPKLSGRSPTPDEHTGWIDSWDAFYDYPWPQLKDADFSSLESAPSILPDGMGIIAGTSGIFEDVWMIMGFENMCLKLSEEPDLVKAVFQKVGEFLIAVFEIAAGFPRVGAMWLSDDLAYTSGPMINPKIYRECLFPWYRQMKAICQSHDQPFILHSDGCLWPILDELVEIGFNALQPIEPKAMDIMEAKKALSGRVSLIGNVDLDYPLSRGSPDEVDRAVYELIRTVAPGGGFCLGSSNTVTSYVPLENYLAMLEACRNYGHYSSISRCLPMERN
jgi:uroporphyrinogen decarboxylase